MRGIKRKLCYELVCVLFISNIFANDNGYFIQHINLSNERCNEISNALGVLYSDHVRLRYFLQGDEDSYLYAFHVAYQTKDCSMQVAVANAYACMKADNDSKKSTSQLRVADYHRFVLASCGYDPWIKLFKKYCEKRGFDFVKGAKENVDQYGFDERSRAFMRIFIAARGVYEHAATRQGFIPARLVQILRRYRHNREQAIVAIDGLAKHSKYPEAIFYQGL